MSQPDEIKILAHDSFRQSLSRRSFLQMGGAAAGMGLMLIGCGSSKSTTSVATTGAPGTTGAGVDCSMTLMHAGLPDARPLVQTNR